MTESYDRGYREFSGNYVEDHVEDRIVLHKVLCSTNSLSIFFLCNQQGNYLERSEFIRVEPLFVEIPSIVHDDTRFVHRRYTLIWIISTRNKLYTVERVRFE